MHKSFFFVILAIFLLFFSILGKNEQIVTNFSSSVYLSYLQNSCRDTNNFENCFIEKLVRTLPFVGPEFMINNLVNKVDESRILGSCHQMAHSLGKEISKKFPDQSNDFIFSSDGKCEFGVAHGIIEKKLSDNRIEVEDPDAVRQICGNDERIDCNHVLGHFLLVWVNKDIEKALSICDVIETKTQVYVCYKGVFMEYITAQNLLTHNLVSEDWFSNEASLEKLKRMCEKYDGLAEISCWEELPHAIVSEFDNDLSRSFSYCDLALEEIPKQRCKNLVSSLITGEVLEHEVDFVTNN